MGEGQEVTVLSRAEAASLLGWWLDAGVDVGIAESPRNWLEKKESAASFESAAPAGGAEGATSEASSAPQSLAPTPATPRESIPATLDAYHAWLAESAELPLFRAGAARALPHGPAEAEIMLLTGIPAAEDAAEGKPIGGEALILTHRMLAAIGFTEAQAYVAALTCFAGAGSRLSQSEAETCREQLLHQIGLVAPKRLLLLGDEPAKLLLGQRLTQARGKVHRVGGISAVVTFHPRHLLGRSADKALAWRDLLLLMGETR